MNIWLGIAVKMCIRDRYASETDYDNENTESANKLEITTDSKFTVELADGTGYTISYLKSKVKKNDPPATTCLLYTST